MEEESETKEERKTEMVETDGPQVFKRELHKVAAVLIYFVFALGFNGVAYAIVHDIAIRKAHSDVVHSLVAQRFWLYMVGDIINQFAMGFTVALVIFHKYSWILVRRMLFMTSIIYLLRSLCMVVTPLSVGYDEPLLLCLPVNTSPLTISRVVRRVFFNIRPPPPTTDGGTLLCGDLMFSGHTAASAISYLMVRHYSIYTLWPLRYFMNVFIMFQILLMSVSRTHYTVDVLVGYWISIGIFCLYHSFCQTPHSRRKTSYHKNLIFYYPTAWLEENTPAGRVPREIAWPLPWPKKLVNLFQKWNNYDLEIQKHRFGHNGKDNKDKTS